MGLRRKSTSTLLEKYCVGGGGGGGWGVLAFSCIKLLCIMKTKSGSLKTLGGGGLEPPLAQVKPLQRVTENLNVSPKCATRE